MNDNPRTSPREKHFIRGVYPSILVASITELRSLQSLLSKFSAFLSDEQSDFARQLEQRAREEGMHEEQRTDFFDAHEVQLHELHTFFPNALWNSLLTLACSLFESRLMEACD